MSYFSLSRRVPEVSALDPWFMAWFYSLIVRLPVVRSIYRRFEGRVLALGVRTGWGLDVGTGPGTLAVELAQRSGEMAMVGVDLAVHMVETAHRRAAQVGMDGRGFWPQADAHSLPFADGSFALVISSFALHHWIDAVAVFNEIARVLAPGGAYHIADVCRETSALQRLFAYASIPAASLPFGSYLAYGGYYESVRAAYTRDEAQELVAQSNLPPGKVGLDSTWFVPVLTISSAAGCHG